MKKHLIVIGTAVLLLAVGLSGCLDSYVEGTGKIQYNDFEDGFYGIAGMGAVFFIVGLVNRDKWKDKE